ncbi:hypothetical protein ACFE04_017052 [Oxalis oulophora]
MEETLYKTTTMEVSSNVKVVSDQDQNSSTRRSVFNYYEVALRLMALLLTLTAAILAGVDKETTSISITLVDGTPPIEIPVKAKWQYLSAFFVAANAIACTYATASLVLTIAMKQNTRATLAINVLDIMILGLLYSANGAATGVGLIAHNGNSHAQWNKVCPMVEGFCHRLGAAIFLSLLGSVVFVWLVVLTVMNLRRKSR